MTCTRRQFYRLFALMLLALATTSAPAADNYLKVVPGTALAWGAVNHMKEASDKIQKLATLLQSPTSNVLDEMKREAGVSKGLDENGAAGFFVVPGKTEKDAVATAIFAAVADEKEFLGNFEVLSSDEKIREVKPKPEEDKPKNAPNVPRRVRNTSTHCLAFSNGYALLAPKSDRAALEAALETKQDISAEMTGWESWLTENDGTVVGTAAGIKFAAKQASAELKKSKDNLGSGPELAVLHTFMDLYGKVLEVAPSELSLALGGVRCDKEGSIRLIGRARLIDGGQLSKAVATIQPVTENLLSGVPGGQFVVAAGGVGVPKLADGYMNLLMGFVKSMKTASGMSPEDMERMSKESLDVFRQVHSMNFVMKSGKRGDPIYSNMYSVMHVDNSRQLLDQQAKYAEKANALIQNGKSGAVKSTSVKRLEIAGKPAIQQEVNFDFSNLPGADANRAMFDEMIGIGGKMLIYYVAADEHTILMGIGVSQERMIAALDVVKQPKKSLAEDADIALTASMLPADSQWAAYLSLRGCMQMSQRLMTMAMKHSPAQERFTLPQFPKSPPIGLAVKALPTELHGEVAIPSALVQAYGDYLKEIQKMFMNQMMQQNQPPAPAP